MKRFNKLENSSYSKGFTLVELLVAVAITGIVVTAAGFGLVTILQANKKAEAQTERRMDLNRALDYIADDIKESSSATTEHPSGWGIPSNTYTLVLFLTKPDSKVAYYTRSDSGVEWRGPQVIYRSEKQDDGGQSEKQDDGGQALVDAISDSPSACTGSGDSMGSEGFKVFVANNRNVKICLKGKVSESETYSVETNAFARSSP